MGSGKKNYKNRPKKFSLGAYKPDKEHKEVTNVGKSEEKSKKT